jgi:hypothetical protein
MSFELFMYKGLYFIKGLTWKFIPSFTCVDSDMVEAKLPLPFDVVAKKVVGPSGNCCTTRKQLLFSDLGDMWLFIGALP